VSATYQTNPNHLRYSNSIHRRLTLVMLWFLRVPLMVRPVFIAISLVLFLATSAGAARINAVRDPAHANVARTSGHRPHHTAKPASRSARSKARASHSTPSRHTTKAASRRTSRSTASTRRRTAAVTRPSTRMRRARYASSHTRARFVPLATVPIERRYTRESSDIPESGPSPAPNAATEMDSAPAPAAEANMTAGGNPLAAPPVETAPAAVGQIASLQVPRVYGRYALRGTHDSLVRQNERVEQESLERILDDADLQDRIARGSLVRVPEASGLMMNPGIPDDRRYCRPWTADFLSELSRAHEAQFHKPLIVSSAVRTVEYQKHLMRVNHNAADAEGDVVSPHLTGATIDIAKSGLSRREMQWMRDHLFAYQTAGVIDVEEEFRQRCFHITVYKNYSPASSPGPHHAPVPQAVPPDPSTATVKDDGTGSNQ
jgi:hypothetical protein